jgi:hypothetical protein
LISMIKVCEKDVAIQGRLLRIARIEGEKYCFPEDPEKVIAGLRACGSRVDLFTFLQRPPETSPKFAYPMEWDNLAVLPISTYDHWWTRQISSITRNRARQAEKKGMVVREVPFDDALLRGIVEIHNETPIRQGKHFPHYGMDLEGARRYAGTFLDRSVFIGALLGEKLIGFVKLTVDDSRTHACAVNILAMLQHRDKAPTNAMIAQAVRSCADRGLSYLVYEHFTYGKKKGDSLSFFKKSNGFRQMDLPRYYVPMTTLGTVALNLGLHRRLVDYFPEQIVAKLRDYRTWWYDTRVHTAAETSGRD